MQKRFIATFDLHFGYERRNGHKVPLHDQKAWNAVMKFAADFKPQVWIHGGDMLDCGVISHHNKQKPGRTEGLRLLSDAEEGRKTFIEPVEALKPEKMVYLCGNHERWLEDLVDEQPGLEGIVNVEKLLGLGKWEVVEQGGVFNLGKLSFVHGDTISGGEHVAKNAVVTYERNIRFGHHHTYQAYTKNTPLTYKFGKTGICVPCLCTKTPKYGGGRPNRWVQGFCFGYASGGSYTDFIVTIIDGQFTVNGKLYKG